MLFCIIVCVSFINSMRQELILIFILTSLTLYLNVRLKFGTSSILIMDENNVQPNLRVGSFNCNGLGSPSKRELVLNWLNKKAEDIILLQETHSTSLSEESWKRTWGGDIYFNHGNSNSTGVAFLIKPNCNIKICNHVIIMQGRTSLLEIEIEKVKYCIVNVYCPNTNETTVVESTFSEALGRTRDDYLILAGDWNTVLNNSLDKAGGSPAHSNSYRQSYLNNIISEYGLSDIFRLNNGDDRVYTHFNKQHKTRTRLDFFLIDDNLVNFPVCHSQITHGFSSDHSYVTLTIEGSTNSLERGKGYWKLNNSHLTNENFRNEVRDIINETASQSYDSYNGLWDVIKMKIKDFAIRYGKKLKKDSEREKKDLENKIETIKRENNFTDNNELCNELCEAEAKLDKLINVEIQGVITRSKIQWTEEGERSTKYFFGLEKSRAKKKAMVKLIDSENNTLSSQADISKHVVDFYQSLYSCNDLNHTDISNYVTSSNLDSIDEDLRNLIDRGITLSECEDVIKHFKNNKSPGWDGLTAEFYKTFWDDIKNILYNSFQESINTGALSPSQRIGILTLIPKPKTPIELNYIKNWRPITLLNVDYKIFAHIIKNRIIKALPSVISKAQSGFQAGRSTNDNLILMALTLDHFNDNPEDGGFILQADLEKAFDSVSHKFLFTVLQNMGFGNYLVNLIKIAFNGCMSFANVNGHLSSPIYLLRGLHQGSPLSPVLFLLVSQVLTKRLENNPDIRGLSISGVSILTSLFADDTDLFMEATADSVDAAIHELYSFGRHSGCKPNINKTKCIPLGAARGEAELLQYLDNRYGSNEVNFITHSFTALGITFNNWSSPSEICELNYAKKLEKVKDLVKTWGKRHLTLIGKCQIIKSLLLAQFTYLVAPLLRPNNGITKLIDKVIFHFLWGGKIDKIRRDVITRRRELGGLDLFRISDFVIGLKVSLINKILNSNFNHPWKNIVINQLKFPDYIVISIENSLTINKCGFTFDLLNCYREWKNRSADASGGTMDHCIWNNSFITDIGSKFWNAVLISKNIMYLSQFVNENGEAMSYEQFITKWDLRVHDLNRTEFATIRMAIRRFNCPNSQSKNISLIDPDISLKFFTRRSNKALRSKNIRDKMASSDSPNTLPPMLKWNEELNTNVDWWGVFSTLFFSFSNNFKLIQFHYKIWHRIATCRYMRHKMKIETDSPYCSLCHEHVETLSHILLDCSFTSEFRCKVDLFIKTNIDTLYSSHNHHIVTLSHSDRRINYINAVANWYPVLSAAAERRHAA